MNTYDLFGGSVKYEKLNDSKLTDFSAIQVGPHFYAITSRKIAGKINAGFGLKSYTFSKSLYNIDGRLWKALQENQEKLDWVEEFKNNTSVLISNGTVIGLSTGSNVDDLVKISEKFNKIDGVGSFIEYDSDCDYISIDIRNQNTGAGLYIIYYNEHNILDIYMTYFDDYFMYVCPFKITSEHDVISFDSLIDVNYLNETYLQTDLCKSSYEEFVEMSNDQTLSIDEVLNILKNIFEIKFNDKFNLTDYIAESDLIFDKNSESYIIDLFKSIDKFKNIAYYSGYLKKSVNFIIDSKKVYNFLAYLFYNSKIKVWMYSDFIESILKSRTNYRQLNDGIEC